MSTIRIRPEQLTHAAGQVWNDIAADIRLQMISRSHSVANELQNSLNMVLRGQRHGKRYRVPVTGQIYTASAPGEPPASRTGPFRESFHSRTFVEQGGNSFAAHGVTESKYMVDDKKKYLLGELLEHGTSRMAARPYQQKVINRTLPRAMRIYRAPYSR